MTSRGCAVEQLDSKQPHKVSTLRRVEVPTHEDQWTLYRRFFVDGLLDAHCVGCLLVVLDRVLACCWARRIHKRYRVLSSRSVVVLAAFSAASSLRILGVKMVDICSVILVDEDHCSSAASVLLFVAV